MKIKILPDYQDSEGLVFQLTQLMRYYQYNFYFYRPHIWNSSSLFIIFNFHGLGFCYIFQFNQRSDFLGCIISYLIERKNLST